MTTLHERLRSARLAAGLSVQDAATHPTVRVNPAELMHAEAPWHIKHPHTMQALADLYRVHARWLLNDEGPRDNAALHPCRCSSGPHDMDMSDRIESPCLHQLDCRIHGEPPGSCNCAESEPTPAVLVESRC